MTPIRRALDALLGKATPPAETVPDPGSTGIRVPPGSVLTSRKQVPLAGEGNGYQVLTVWRLKVPGTTAETVARFYEDWLGGEGWSLEPVESFRNGYGQRLKAASASRGESLSITIAKWPHEDFVSLSVYRYGD